MKFFEQNPLFSCHVLSHSCLCTCCSCCLECSSLPAFPLGFSSGHLEPGPGWWFLWSHDSVSISIFAYAAVCMSSTCHSEMFGLHIWLPPSHHECSHLSVRLVSFCLTLSLGACLIHNRYECQLNKGMRTPDKANVYDHFCSLCFRMTWNSDHDFQDPLADWRVEY